MKAKLMSKAWVLAKEGAKLFGGSPREYLADALRMVWAEMKGVKQVQVPLWEIKTEHDPVGDREIFVLYKEGERILGICSSKEQAESAMKRKIEGQIETIKNLFNYWMPEKKKVELENKIAELNKLIE